MINIDEFQHKVIRLQPTNFMAMGGAAPGIIGSVDSGSSSVEQLKRAVIDFVGYYKEGNEKYLVAARKEVLAKLMVSLTMDAITQHMADELIENLQQLMKERKE